MKDFPDSEKKIKMHLSHVKKMEKLERIERNKQMRIEDTNGIPTYEARYAEGYGLYPILYKKGRYTE